MTTDPNPTIPQHVFDAADAARTAYLRDVDCNDQIGALYTGIQAAFVAAAELHTREGVKTSDADTSINRYRVPGGWLYHATASRGGSEPITCALCFVPDLEILRCA